MMDVVNFQRGRELLFDHHHFLNELEAPSSEMKVSGGSDYKQGWRFPEEGEKKGFVGSMRTSEAELVSSSESTEEDDDYIAELTRQMTHYMLQDDDKHALKTSLSSSEKNEESWGFVGWQSDSTTIWSLLGSSSGSPEGPSQEPSPPVTPGKDQASEHKSPPSYAAVLCRLDKLETNKQGNPSGTTQVAEAENSKQGVASDQSQDSKIKLKQGQSSKKQSSINNGRQPKHITHQKVESYNQKEVGSCVNGGLRPPLPIANLPANPWLSNQQGPSNKRPVFLGGSGSGSRVVGTPSCGTGVFLPCVIGSTSQSPKNKRGCAPVLIPAKVVQALKVHFDRVGDRPRQNPTAFPMQNESSKGGRRTNTSANRKRHSRGAAPSDMNNEMGLPHEWTY